ncbi:putative ubiquitin carboxyl-terminal hydrolase family protein [Diaporthe ampelina]|uniref:Putative ubiquitin carboxyl-terminal hydrolase family protein n=1 Tax=Diaporthe ampelina TaxID=1214573 RepID=A0A0G2FTW0_9PEZI|nr:putative ubiquitin carboxyl-terminal hydrolase family protein [Diaporthe ampelina]
MSSSPSAFPTPRRLLTSILNQISEIPAPSAPGPGNIPTQDSSTITRTGSFPERAREPSTNSLRLIDARHRPLFTTLHVLFPSLLLPALDLLDRGLVTRLVSPDEAATAMPAEESPLAHQDDQSHEPQEEDGRGSHTRDSTAVQPPPPSSVYLVRSAQKPARRPYGGGGGGGGDAPATTSVPTSTSTSQRTYLVHTAAWNCTCAAFAFSAFPPLAGEPSLLAPGQGIGEPVSAMAIMDDRDYAEEGEEGEGTRRWQFGGLSFDGCTGAGGVPPCCKHLLACVLAERWQCGLGRYVARREVGREEMAGVFADV